MSNYEWLVDWFASQCDGRQWEHQSGIKLDSLDNPGWHLEVGLIGTPLENRPFAKVEHDLKSDVSWWVCRVEHGKFDANCGPRDLSAVIGVFKAWASEA